MFSISNEQKSVKIILFSLLAIFLAGCIFASFYYNDKLILGSFEKFDNDDVKYLRSAQTFINTGKLTYKYPEKETCFIMPGITFVLTPFVAIFGMKGAIMPVRIFFAFFQTFNLFMVFLIGRKIFNSKIALVTVFLSILYLPNIYVSTLLLTETMAYTFILLLILFVIYGTEKKSKKYFVIAGIIWGLAIMFRSTLAAFPLIVFIYWLIKRFKIIDMFKLGMCAIIPMVLILSPWVIRNYIVFDKFIPLTYASGNPTWQGTIINYDRDRYNYEVLPNINIDDIDWGDNEITCNEAETELASRIFKYNIKNHTGEYIKWYTIGKTEKNLEHPFMWYPIFLGEYNLIWYFHSALLMVAFLGVVVMLIRKKFTHEIWLLFVIFWFFNCIHLPFYCFPRYMYPAMFIVLMINAYCIYHVWLTLKNGVIRYKENKKS